MCVRSTVCMSLKTLKQNTVSVIIKEDIVYETSWRLQIPRHGHKICHRISHDLAAADRATRNPFTIMLKLLHREQ